MMSSTSPVGAPKASTRASASHQPFDEDPATQRFVIGKIDAGIAVLISDSVHLIEFPSLLLPSGVGPGSIVNIACTRNVSAEKQHAREFWDLQREIAETFGKREPEAPKLRVRNTTQTSVTLEWDKLDLASASLINLSIYRNGQRLTTIPNPLHNTSTKLSGLQLDTDYSFHLVLKTSAGTYTSPTVKTRTHTIDNTTGICVCFGLVEPEDLANEASEAVKQLGAKSDDKIQIDTTHFVATSSASRSNPDGGPGVEYQKAVQLSIPIVTPEWLLACVTAKKLVPISPYYLGQTNRAASLSSAQLVSSTGSPSSTALPLTQRQPRPVAVAERPSQPTVVERDEDEQRAEQVAKPPVELEEDVEGPPEDQQAEPELEPEQPPATEPAAEDETDASTRAIKSDTEPSKDAVEETATPTISISPPPEETVIKEDLPAEELLQEQGSTGAGDVDGTALEGKSDQPAKADAAEAAESDVEEDQRPEAQDGESSLVDIKL
ncbi:hypothetical protein NBRC10512v2_001028 [Rhodotorula toruloides]